jgi:hypothetical protein
MSTIAYTVIHAGAAHRDEMLALGLAVHAGLIGEGSEVFRRDPLDEELDSSEVLVLDVGMRHEPELHNYDHHQLERGTVECALSLLAKSCKFEGISYDELFGERSWYQATKILDSQGPYVLAKSVGLDKLPTELMSPVEDAVLRAMEECSGEVPLPGWLLALCGATITNKVIGAVKLREGIKFLEDEAVLVPVQDFHLVMVPSTEFTGMEDYRAAREEDTPVSVLYDDRGEGYTLFRFDDDPRIDFSKLEGDERILFAHKGGFIAKTLKRLPQEEVAALVEKAVVSRSPSD